MFNEGPLPVNRLKLYDPSNLISELKTPGRDSPDIKGNGEMEVIYNKASDTVSIEQDGCSFEFHADDVTTVISLLTEALTIRGNIIKTGHPKPDKGA